MQRRRIPVLDAMFDRISMLLWPRFKQVLAANISSIKTANPRKLGALDLTPHVIVRYVSSKNISMQSCIFYDFLVVAGLYCYYCGAGDTQSW
jgi:hypothetical protein